METKRCGHCGRILPIDQFSKKSKSKDGLRPYCKSCYKGIQEARKAGKKDEESEDKTYYPSNAVAPADETNALEKFTPRQLLKELKRRGYRWSGMSVVMTIDYESI
jgi:hypothetical protein